MAHWWPIDRNEHAERGCDACGSHEGRSMDEDGRVYCFVHRDEHER